MSEEGAEYTYDQIIGLSVEDEAGLKIGVVSAIIKTGANDVYFVRRPDGEEVLIPAIKQVVRKIDLAAGKMVIDPMDGLL